jgi:hypothetical protein
VDIWTFEEVVEIVVEWTKDVFVIMRRRVAVDLHNRREISPKEN